MPKLNEGDLRNMATGLTSTLEVMTRGVGAMTGSFNQLLIELEVAGILSSDAVDRVRDAGLRKNDGSPQAIK